MEDETRSIHDIADEGLFFGGEHKPKENITTIINILLLGWVFSL